MFFSKCYRTSRSDLAYYHKYCTFFFIFRLCLPFSEQCLIAYLPCQPSARLIVLTSRVLQTVPKIPVRYTSIPNLKGKAAAQHPGQSHAVKRDLTEGLCTLFKKVNSNGLVKIYTIRESVSL